MIRVLRSFILIIIACIIIVWLSDNPGKVEIIWNDYFIQTDIIGIVLFLFFLITVILLIYISLKSIRQIPKSIRIKKNERYLKLANNSLDDIVEGILFGDPKNIEKNSRLLKKYLNNEVFSTFMLFNSSLVENNFYQSQKYLNLLESIPKANYIAKRGKVILYFKKKKNKDLKDLLISLCKEFPDDEWFHDKLSRLYSLENEWKLASQTISKINYLSDDLREYSANLKILSGDSPVSAINLSANSIPVVKENIKLYISQSNFKKASELIRKTWLNLLCNELIEIFMLYKSKGEKDTLRRYKFIVKALKKYLSEESNETKFSLAYASYEASIWGESVRYLELIKKEELDARMKELYSKISSKSQKIKISSFKLEVLPSPKWKCLSCEYQHDEWKIVCDNCKLINTIQWSKSRSKRIPKHDFYRDFLKNPLRHLPQMKREN